MFTKYVYQMISCRKFLDSQFAIASQIYFISSARWTSAGSSTIIELTLQNTWNAFG